jgi:hypothetical protein
MLSSYEVKGGKYSTDTPWILYCSFPDSASFNVSQGNNSESTTYTDVFGSHSTFGWLLVMAFLLQAGEAGHMKLFPFVFLPSLTSCDSVGEGGANIIEEGQDSQ